MGAIASDRRVVTVLFADLSGFTRAAARLDPEDVSALLERTIGALAAEVAAHGGWVEKQAGDAILSVFGAPVAHEDDPARAVGAAVAIRDRLRSMRPELERGFGERFTVHIGINTGLVVMRPRVELPGAPPDDFIVVGDAVNTAARLYQAAGADQIFVGRTTYELTRTRFEYRPAPDVVAKGKDAPVAAYECVQATAAPGDAPAATTAVFGRESELAELERWLTGVRAGRGAIVLVEGEPGVGKSRLLEEFKRQAADIRVVSVRGHERARTEGYAPFAAVLRELTALPESGAAAADALGALLREREVDRANDAVRYLVPLIAGAEAPLEYDALEAEAARRQIFRAFRLIFETVAAEAPLIVLVDDWHWVDESSAALLDHLAPLVADAALLVVCSSRLDDAPPVALLRRTLERLRSGAGTRIQLGSLDRAATASFAAELLRLDELPPRAAAAVHGKSGGNPFFIEEVVRSLLESEGVDTRDGSALRAASRADTLDVPSTVQGVIAARVDRLDAAAKELLRVASVVGRSFDADLVAAVADPRADVQAVLAHLEERRLVRRAGGGARYAFEHALTQETVYNSVLRERRRELHAAVAARLRERGFDNPGVLAWHLAAAEQWDEAQEQLVAAGDRAGAIAADAEALAHYRQAMEAAARASGPEWDPQRRADLERKIGEALFRLGEHQAALAALRSALALLGHPYPSTARAIRAGLFREGMRRAVRAILPRALSANGTVDPAAVADARARIYETIGWIDYFADPLGYAHLALVNLNSSERNGHVYGTAIGTMGVALVLDVLGWFRLAERYHRRALVLAERTSSMHAVAFAHVGLSYFCESVARFDEAVEHSRRGGKLYRDVGEIRKWGAAIYMSASVALLRGDWPTAERLARDAVAIGKDAGDELTHGWGRMWLGRTQAARGLLDEAEADLRSAIPLVGSIPDYGSLATIHAVLADIAARRGDRAAALERAAASMSIVRERGLRGRLAIEPFNVTASLLVDELADPVTRTRRHRRDARRAVGAALRHARLERQAVPAALRAAGTSAWIRGRRRSARRLWNRSLARADELGMPFEHAQTRMARGRWTGAEADIAAAEAAQRRLAAPRAE